MAPPDQAVGAEAPDDRPIIPAGAPALSRPPDAYRWAPTLLLPERPPILVYLDLNHWVELSKAHAGHYDGPRFQDALDACISAVSSGAAVFPLADAIYYEVMKISSRRQRRHLADVMESVSRYVVVTSRSVVADHEVEGVLDELVGPNLEPINAMRYLDWGVARAFGMVGGFRIVSDETGEDVTEQVRDNHPEGAEAFDRALVDAELRLNRRTIEGPEAEEESELRRRGWDPTVAHRVAAQRARQEIDQAARFDAHPTWRRGRIRDVVAAREVLVELMEKFERGLKGRGVDRDVMFADNEAYREALDSMPSYDVAVTIKAEYHRDGQHRWTPNDIHDIDALGSTIPYCDVVVTDRAAAANANRSGLAARFGTRVLSSLNDLVDLIT